MFHYNSNQNVKETNVLLIETEHRSTIAFIQI